MWLDPVSNPRSLALESDSLPTLPRSQADLEVFGLPFHRGYPQRKEFTLHGEQICSCKSSRHCKKNSSAETAIIILLKLFVKQQLKHGDVLIHLQTCMDVLD